MSLLGPFVYKSKKGEKWWLHAKTRGKRVLYYFTKDPADALWTLPLGYEVVENPKTGLPMLKKKSGQLFDLFGGKKQAKKE